MSSEGNDLYHEMIEGGVIKISEGSTAGSKAALVYGQMNEPPGIPLHNELFLLSLRFCKIFLSFFLVLVLCLK